VAERYAIVYTRAALSALTKRHELVGSNAVPGWIVDVIPESRLLGMTTAKLLAGRSEWLALRDVTMTFQEFNDLRCRKSHVDPATKLLQPLPECDAQGYRLWREPAMLAISGDDLAAVEEIAKLLGWDFFALSYDEKEAFAQEYLTQKAAGVDPLARLRAQNLSWADRLKAVVEKAVAAAKLVLPALLLAVCSMLGLVSFVHAYLYTVGSGGETYATITLALAAVFTDWSTDVFDGEVEVRVSVGTYNETIRPNTTMMPSPQFPLLLKNKAGDAPVISRTTLGAAVFSWANTKMVVLDGLTFSNSNSGNYNDFSAIRGIIRNCTINTGCTAHMFQSSLGPLSIKDSSFVLGTSAAYSFFYQAGNVVAKRCSWRRTTGRWMHSTYGTLIVEACTFAGFTTLLGWDSAGSGPVIFNGCTLVNCGGFCTNAANTSDNRRMTRLVNCIFRNMTTSPVIDFRFQQTGNIEIESCDFSGCAGDFVRDDAGSYATLGALQAAGYDTLHKCITGDPLLTSEVAGSEDVHLQAGSPCINAGIGAAVLKDRWGTAAASPHAPAIGCDFSRDVAPSAATILVGTTINQVAGTYHEATVGEVVDGVMFGPGSSYEGTVSVAPPDPPTVEEIARVGTAITVTVSGVGGNVCCAWLLDADDGSEIDEATPITGDGDLELELDHVGRDAVVVVQTRTGAGSYSEAVVDRRYYPDDSLSRLEQLMAALASELTAQGYKDSDGRAITGIVEDPPNFDAVKTAVIKVFPGPTDEVAATHAGLNDCTLRVAVALCQRADTTARRSTLMSIRQAIQDRLVGRRLSGLAQMYCPRASMPDVRVGERWWEQQEWISPIELEFVELRARG
jgi:hypothetical protein